MGGETECFTGNGFRYALYFVKNLAGPDNGHPAFGGTFAFSHSSFGGLLRKRLVGEDSDPDLAPAFHMARDGDTGGFDLPGGKVTGPKRLKPEITEADLASPEAVPLMRPFCTFRI